MPSAPPRRKHLMDPSAPRVSPVVGGSGGMSITTVQRWVLTVLVLTTVEHFALAFVFAAAYLDAGRMGERVLLLVLAGLVGLLGVAGALLLHARSALSWWLPWGLLPAVAGAVWVFW